MDDFGTLNLNDDNTQDPSQNTTPDPASNDLNSSANASSMQDNSTRNLTSQLNDDPVVPMSDDMQNLQRDLSAMADNTDQNGGLDLSRDNGLNMDSQPDVDTPTSDNVTENVDSNTVLDLGGNDLQNNLDSGASNDQSADMNINVDPSFSVQQNPVDMNSGSDMQNNVGSDAVQMPSDNSGDSSANQQTPPQDFAQPTQNQDANMQQVGQMNQVGVQPGMQPNPMQGQPVPQQVPPINVPPDKDPNVYRFLVDAIYAKHGAGVDTNFVTQEADRLYVQLGDLLVNSFEGDLNDQQKEEFNGLVAQGYQNEDLQGYLLQNITNLEQRIQEILIQFRNNYMAS